MKIIVKKLDGTIVGKIQDNTDYEWELEHNVIPNFGGSESDYLEIITDIQKPKINIINGNIQVVERPKESHEIKAEKQKEFDKLSDIVTVDDLIDILKSKGIISDNDFDNNVKQKLNAKKQLRQELRNL